MTREIPVDRLRPHPMNANRMTEVQRRKLRRHLRRTGRYPPLVVRPLGEDPGEYQVLDGHHRLECLRGLGYRAVRCEVWEVDDREALVLLATLNRLQGRDDPDSRAALLARLAEATGEAGEPLVRRLARLLPEDRGALDRALALARKPLPAPAKPEDAPVTYRPVTFFLTEAEHERVGEALRAAARPDRSNATSSDGAEERATGRAARGRRRARALAVLADRFLGDPGD